MTTIKLPPLPEPEHEEFTDDCTFWSPEGWSREQLRARDIEVAKCVLEAAAQAASPDDSYQDEWFRAKTDAVNRIRALEVSESVSQPISTPI